MAYKALQSRYFQCRQINAKEEIDLIVTGKMCAQVERVVKPSSCKAMPWQLVRNSALA